MAGDRRAESNSHRVIRVAAMADLHCSRGSAGTLAPLFAEAADQADILVICGDLTDYGLPEEAHILAKELAGAKVPTVVVLGNHDYESGHESEVVSILCDAGITVLDGEATEIHEIGFAGAKGFGGGFGRRMLSPWGEPAIKAFVNASVEEELKLERALGRLTTPQRIVLLHYAPVRTTVEGESPETFPFLGSSRLEEPLGRYPVSYVLHGHAHLGSPEGVTSHGIPVYNVSLPLLRKADPHGRPFRLLELAVEVPAPEPANA